MTALGDERRGGAGPRGCGGGSSSCRTGMGTRRAGAADGVLGDRHGAAVRGRRARPRSRPGPRPTATPGPCSTRCRGSSASSTPWSRRCSAGQRPTLWCSRVPGCRPAVVDRAHPRGADHPGRVLPPVGEHGPHRLGGAATERETRGRRRCLVVVGHVVVSSWGPSGGRAVAEGAIGASPGAGCRRPRRCRASTDAAPPLEREGAQRGCGDRVVDGREQPEAGDHDRVRGADVGLAARPAQHPHHPVGDVLRGAHRRRWCRGDRGPWRPAGRSGCRCRPARRARPRRRRGGASRSAACARGRAPPTSTGRTTPCTARPPPRGATR